MNLDISNPTFYYSFFFVLAHFISWVILIWYGFKHKFPLLQWLLIIVTGYVFFTIGSHLFAIDLTSLRQIVFLGEWPIISGKSLVSGFLFAIPAMLGLKYLIKFNYSIFEPYAFTIPLGIAIQRLGCLAAGCCYGNYSNVPWAISYSYGHKLHFMQWQQGLIAKFQPSSIALHPVQLYEAILCLMVLALVIFLYKRNLMKSRLIYVFLLGYSFIRFFTEFYRSETSHNTVLANLFGINSVQWVMLFASLLFLSLLLIRRKKRFLIKSRPDILTKVSIMHGMWLAILFVLILITPKLYSSLELLLLGVLLIPLSVIFFWEILWFIAEKKIRVGSVGLIVLGIFLMSQKSPLKETSEDPESYHEFSIGGFAGINEMTRFIKGCDGSKTDLYDFKDSYYAVGLGYSYSKLFDNKDRISAGIGVSYGGVKEQVEGVASGYVASVPKTEETFYSFSPYIQYDTRLVGIGAGVNTGNPLLFRPDFEIPSMINTEYTLLPSIHLRIGNLNKFWVEANYAKRFASISPTSEFEVLAGVRGEKGNIVRFGTSAYQFIVIRPEFHLGNGVYIEPHVGFLGPVYTSNIRGVKGIEAGINLHYRLYSKKVK